MPDPISPDGLVEAAKVLLRAAERENESQAVADSLIRRAVSTAYYALFHQACALVAFYMSPAGDDRWQIDLWRKCYRTPDHDAVRKAALRVVEATPALPKSQPVNGPPLELLLDWSPLVFCNAFLDLHKARQSADYVPDAAISVEEAAGLVGTAHAAISFGARGMTKAQARRLVAEILSKERHRQG